MGESSDLYYKKANKEGLESIPEPYRTIVAINTAQAMIENGGFEYFFENYFPGRDKDLNIIVDSYKEIGFDREAGILDKLVQMYFKDRNRLFCQYIEEEKVFLVTQMKFIKKLMKLKAVLESYNSSSRLNG